MSVTSICRSGLSALSVFLSFCSVLFVSLLCLSVCQSVWLVCLSSFIYRPFVGLVDLSVWCVCLSILSVFLSVCVPGLSVCLFLSVCPDCLSGLSGLSAYLFFVSVLSVCLSFSVRISSFLSVWFVFLSVCLSVWTVSLYCFSVCFGSQCILSV